MNMTLTKRLGSALLAGAALLAAGAARADTIVILNSEDASYSLVSRSQRAEITRLPVGREPHHLIASPDGKEIARSEPAASMTSRRSSACTSSGATSPGEKRSEQPHPRRSVWITRASVPSPVSNRARCGLAQFRSTCEV